MSRSSILLGQYIKRNSYLHTRDPRGKLALVLLSLLLLLCISSPFSFVLVMLLYLFLATLSRISIFLLLRSVKPIIYLAIFTFILHCFFEKGGFTAYGVSRGLFFALRLVFMALFSGLYTATTTPEKIATSLAFVLKPFSHLFDVQSFSIMITMSLRFIPIISLETRKLIFAQASRGVDFEAKKLRDRLRAYASVLAPEFLLLFSHADKLALAMESRGYVPGARRTSLHPLKWNSTDTQFLTAILIACAVILVCDKVCFL